MNLQAWVRVRSRHESRSALRRRRLVRLQTAAAAVSAAALLAGCSQPDPAPPSPEELRAQYCVDYASDGYSGGREWLDRAAFYHTIEGVEGSKAKETPVELKALLITAHAGGFHFDCNDEEYRPLFDMYVEYRKSTD